MKNYLSCSGAFFAYRINFSCHWHSFHGRDTMWKFWIQKKEKEERKRKKRGKEDIPLYHKGRVRQPFRMRFYWGKESSISVFTLRGNQKAIMMRIEEEKKEKRRKNRRTCVCYSNRVLVFINETCICYYFEKKIELWISMKNEERERKRECIKGRMYKRGKKELARKCQREKERKRGSHQKTCFCSKGSRERERERKGWGNESVPSEERARTSCDHSIWSHNVPIQKEGIEQEGEKKKGYCMKHDVTEGVLMWMER